MRRIRIHSAAQARAVLETARATGRPVTLVSPVATQAGIGWWRELTAQAAAEFAGLEFDAVLDCGPSAGLALQAIRTGMPAIEVQAAPEVLEKLTDIAQQAGVRAEGGGKPALDLLGMPDMSRTCRDWLVAEDAEAEAWGLRGEEFG